MDLVEFLRHRAVELDDFARVARLPAKHRARYAREAESLRGIVHEHQPKAHYPSDCGVCDQEVPCMTLRLLALPYADHPDYDQSWKP